MMGNARPWTHALLLLAGRWSPPHRPARQSTPRKNCGSVSSRRRPAFSRSSAPTCQNGLQMYLDEHNGVLGGAKVTMIVEDDQGKPDTGVTKANKLISDKVDMLVGGVLATTGYALAPVATREKMLYIGSIATADDLGTARFREIPLHGAADLRAVAAEPSARPMGLRAGLQADRRDRRRLCLRPRNARRLPEDIRGLRRQDRAEDLAADRHQGLRALHPDDQERHRRDLRADGGADVAAIPQAAARRRQQEADPRRRHQLRRIHPALDGRRGDRRRLVVHVQRGARHAEERGVREQVPRQVRQGAVLLFGGQLHHRADGSTRR